MLGARTTSLSPSDSMSRIQPEATAPATTAPSTTGASTTAASSESRSAAPYVHQPATRPPQYPQEILWSLEDSKTDEDVAASKGNLSRPAMGRVIRHVDGSEITPGEYNAIRATAHAIAYDLNEIPIPPGRPGLKGKPRTMRFYKTHMLREWNQAVADAENQQELLKYCSSHWKAEHMLSAALQAARSAETCTYLAPTSRANTYHTNLAKSQTSGAKRPRSTSDATTSTANGKKPRARSDSTTERAKQKLRGSTLKVADSSTPTPQDAPIPPGTSPALLPPTAKHVVGTSPFSWTPTSAPTPDTTDTVPTLPTLVDPAYDNLISM